MLYFTSIIGLLILSFGKSTQFDYIVGGRDATISEYPYQIALLFFGGHVCGGSIISAGYVLTAAHCTYGSTFNQFSVRAGSNSAKEGGQKISANHVYIHPQYNDKTVDNDVCLIELETKFILGPKVQIVVIVPINTIIPVGVLATVTGWGHLSENGANPKALQVLQVPKLEDEKCVALYPEETITSRMMCFGYIDGGKDSCQGDSGGPLVWNNMQIGIVSWGYGCARPDLPGMYTNIRDPAIHNFITQYVKE